MEAARRVKARGGGRPLLCRRPGPRAGRRRLAAADSPRLAIRWATTRMTMSTSRRADGGDSIPLPTLALADRGPRAGGRDPRKHPADDAAMKRGWTSTPRGFRTPGGFGRRPVRPPRLAADAAGPWLQVGQQQISRPPRSAGWERSRTPSVIRDDRGNAGAKRSRFGYPSGLIEVPMSPISDIGAFRTGRWKLEWFLRAIRLGVEWAIEHRAASSISSATRRACM